MFIIYRPFHLMIKTPIKLVLYIVFESVRTQSGCIDYEFDVLP